MLSKPTRSPIAAPMISVWRRIGQRPEPSGTKTKSADTKLAAAASNIWAMVSAKAELT